MTAEEALALLDRLPGQPLRDIQEQVFRYAWQGWTYSAIAMELGYDTGHIRDVGAQLWQQLSQTYGEVVTKKNLQAVVRRQGQHKSNSDTSISVSQNADMMAFNLRSPHIATNARAATPEKHQHWGEVLDVSVFYGRHLELQQLQQWILQDRCRLVSIVGMGGMGKTSLAAKLAEQIQAQFDVLIWQSLRNAPLLEDLLPMLLQVLSGQQIPLLPTATSTTGVAVQVSHLMEYLRSSRCLLILDNVEVILANALAGQYRSGYEPYGELLQRVAREHHASCLLLTSREQPKTLLPLEGKTSPIRTLALTGLGSDEGRKIVQADGCFAQTETDWLNLTQHYSGNPLALKIVSTAVRDLFDGSIATFLAQGAIAFGDINELLDTHFNRLSEPEQAILYWLAIERDWVSLTELRENCLSDPSPSHLLEALLSLQHRSLIEKKAGLFTLQPVVMEYITEQFVGKVALEIETQTLKLFNRHALIKAQAKDYIRDSQIRVILGSLVNRLMYQLRSQKDIEYQLSQMLFILRSQYPNTIGYAGGNLINLLNYLNVDLSGYDFSHLCLWQAYLQGVTLHRVNFAYSEFAKSTFTQTFGSILAIAFSPDGTHIATGGVNEDVCLWNVAAGQRLLTCQGHKNWVLSVAFAPQGDLLASGAEDHTIKVWHVPTGECLKTLAGHTNYVHAVAFSPTGQVLASGSIDQTIKLWDMPTGHCLHTLQGHGSWVESVSFHPTGVLLASSGGDHTLKLWDVTTGECLKTMTGHTGQVCSVAFVGDRALASGSSDQTLKLWDIKTGECIRTLHGHQGQIWSIAVSHDGQFLASGSHDQTIKLWQIQTGKCLHTLQGHCSQVRAIAFNADSSMLASGSGDQTIRFWDAATGQCLKTLQGFSRQIWSVCIANPDQNSLSSRGMLLASGDHDHAVRVWDLSTEQCLKTLRGHSSWVRSVAFSPDGNRLASGSGDQTIRLWDVATGHCLKTLRGHQSWIRSVTFSPDGNYLASSAHDRTIRLWNLSTEHTERVFSADTVWTRGIAFSPDGLTLVSCYRDTQLALWDVTTGEQLHSFVGHTAQVWSVAFSRDGLILASSSRDHTVKLWDVTTGRCLKTLGGHSREVWSVAVSPDGMSVASGGDDATVRVWDISSGQSLGVFHGHARPVQSIVYSPDAQTLISGSEDETIKIWDLKTGQCLTTLRAERPYEGIDITGVKGLTAAQKTTLFTLGAVSAETFM